MLLFEGNIRRFIKQGERCYLRGEKREWRKGKERKEKQRLNNHVTA
jgi:hypothetical protein